jgi:hypothetical protein
MTLVATALTRVSIAASFRAIPPQPQMPSKPIRLGESGGYPRNVASPDINTEDFSAAVDFLGLQKEVDHVIHDAGRHRFDACIHRRVV